MNLKEIAKEVFFLQSKAINNLSHFITEDFEKAILEISKTKGKLIVSGMGKSGIIGKKIAATLASTGTPSFFLHPGEAYHGDLGMIEKQDIVLLISNSGETDEILKIIPFLKEQGNKIIAMTKNINATLAKKSDYHLNIFVKKEACPLQLAPTCSTTATLVMGDAVAVALMKIKNFKKEHFAKFHPGGNLGKKLLAKVADFMKKDYLPIVNPNASSEKIIEEVNRGKCGLAVVMEKNTIKGIITDGDMRRAMADKKASFFDLKAEDLMTKNPITIAKNEKWSQAMKMMNEKSISRLLVVDDNKNFVGIMEVFDN